MSLPRPLARAAVVTAALVGLVGAGAGIASAHVTVSSPNASPGGSGTIVFNVPDESDTASTVRVRIQIPASTPLASVSVQPVPGWTVTETSAALKHPLTTDDGDRVTSAVSVVDFRAAAGSGIAPGQFQQFTLSAGPLPKSAQMAFNVVQTYSDGTEAAWIEPTLPGQPEPQHPSPILKLSSPGAASPAAGPAPASSGGSSGTAVAALVVACVAAVLGAVGAFLGRRASRRTVSR